jgi:glycosyltransferase involved in cell wall biosynthesis
MEAMAASLPTRRGWCARDRNEGKGYLLVEMQNPGSLAGAIARLLDDTALRNRISENAQTASACSPGTHCGFMISLYNRCLAKGETNERYALP